VPPLAASIAPRAARRGRPGLQRSALLGATSLLALVSFTSGYLLRDRADAPGSPGAAARPQAGVPLAPPVAPVAAPAAAAAATSPSNTAASGPSGENADSPLSAALAAASPSDVAVHELPAPPPELDEIPPRGAAGTSAPLDGPASATRPPLPPPGTSKAAARIAPPGARSEATQAGRAPLISEPRVRVIGVTEPSVRVLD
jgi:hypothetical protein